jgi:hypothetical protein
MAPPTHRQPISSEEAQRRLALLREAKEKMLSQRPEQRKDRPWMDMKVKRNPVKKTRPV